MRRILFVDDQQCELDGMVGMMDWRELGLEVAGAVTASTLTTVAVFAPISLVGGPSGELLRPFGITVTIALTVFAGPLYDLCARIGDALSQPVTLVELDGYYIDEYPNFVEEVAE